MKPAYGSNLLKELNLQKDTKGEHTASASPVSLNILVCRTEPVKHPEGKGRRSAVG